MLWIGLLIIAVAICIYILKLEVARYPDGGVPVLDGVVFPPLFVTWGLVLMGFAGRVGTGDWIYFTVWLALTVLAFWGIDFAGKLGKREED